MDNTSQSSVPPIPPEWNTEYAEFLEYRRQQQMSETPVPNYEVGVFVQRSLPPSEGSAIPQILLDDLLLQPGREKLPRLDPDVSENTTWFKYSGSISKTILKLIRDLNHPYVSYDSLPETIKNGWFRAFAQEYNWDSGITSLVKAGFEKQAKLSFVTNMHEWKKRWLAEKGKPKWMSERVWAGFVEYWRLEKTKEIALKNSQNRRSDRGGDGLAIHNIGAKTYQRRKQELTDAKGGVEPTMLELLEDTRTCKKTGIIKDKRVKRIIESVQEQVHEIHTQRSTTDEGSSTQNSKISASEINRLVIEATPRYNGRPLGFGTLVDSYGSTSRRREAQDTELVRLQQLTEQQSEVIANLQASQEELKRNMKKKDKKMQMFMKTFYQKFPDTGPDGADSETDDDETQG